MMIKEIIGKILAGERDGTTLWKIAINEIEYPPVTDPAEGVSVAALAENILRCGQLQPILLRRHKEIALKKQPYQLIAGRRRVEAMRMLGYTHVHAIVVRCEPERVAVLSMSENLLRREPNFWELAERAKLLVEGGMSIDRLAQLLALHTDEVQELLDLLELPLDDLHLMKLTRVPRKVIPRLMALPAHTRREILEQFYMFPENSVDDLIDDWNRQVESYPVQFHKFCVNDVRLFTNTIERAVETMSAAAFDTKFERTEESDGFTFSIRVSKRPGAQLNDPIAQDVSRETSANRIKQPRFSSALSIFEAIAEDEKMVSMDVSRETYAEDHAIAKENTEKLDLCIDCLSKK